MGRMDWHEIPTKRQILYSWRAQSHGNGYRKRPGSVRRTKRVDGSRDMSSDRFQIITPAHADYRNLVRGLTREVWPEFMLHDRVANENWHELFNRFWGYQLALYDTENHRVAG